jgi:hypothetical protein
MEGPLRVWTGSLPEPDMTDRRTRLALNPIVRSLLDHRLDPAARAERYGSLLTDYVITGPDDAEVALIHRSFEHVDRKDFRHQVAEAERRGLRTLVFSGNDLEPMMPSPSIILLHPGPTRGAQPHADVLAMPYFFTDRLERELGPSGGAVPSVAFCGQGAARRGSSTVRAVGRAVDLASNRLRPRVVPPPIRGHVALRADALRRLRADPRVEDRFVIRTRYRAGAATQEERARTQDEFDANLLSAQYALCVRGTGNFSARFFEALSFGRVPVFVDTRCVLPFEDEIDWRQHTVWLDRSQVADIGDIVVRSHAEPDPDGFRTPAALRQLWLERLTEDGYFRHLVPAVRRLL